MHIVRDISHQEAPKKGKLSNNKEAIRAWVQVWKMKNNERLQRQLNTK